MSSTAWSPLRRAMSPVPPRPPAAGPGPGRRPVLVPSLRAAVAVGGLGGLTGLGDFWSDVFGGAGGVVDDLGHAVGGTIDAGVATVEDLGTAIARGGRVLWDPVGGIAASALRDGLRAGRALLNPLVLLRGIPVIDDINSAVDGLAAAAVTAGQAAGRGDFGPALHLARTFGPLIAAVCIPGAGLVLAGALLARGLVQGGVALRDVVGLMVQAACPAAAPLVAALQQRDQGLRGMLLAAAVSALPEHLRPLMALAQDPTGALAGAAIGFLPPAAQGYARAALAGNLRDVAVAQVLGALPPEAAAAVRLVHDRGGLTAAALAAVPPEARDLAQAAATGSLPDVALARVLSGLPPEAAAAVALAHDPHGAVTAAALGALPAGAADLVRAYRDGRVEAAHVAGVLDQARGAAGAGPAAVGLDLVLERLPALPADAGWSAWTAAAQDHLGQLADADAQARQAAAAVRAATTTTAQAQAGLASAQAALARTAQANASRRDPVGMQAAQQAVIVATRNAQAAATAQATATAAAARAQAALADRVAAAHDHAATGAARLAAQDFAMATDLDAVTAQRDQATAALVQARAALAQAQANAEPLLSAADEASWRQAVPQRLAAIAEATGSMGTWAQDCRQRAADLVALGQPWQGDGTLGSFFRETIAQANAQAAWAPQARDFGVQAAAQLTSAGAAVTNAPAGAVPVRLVLAVDVAWNALQRWRIEVACCQVANAQRLDHAHWVVSDRQVGQLTQDRDRLQAALAQATATASREAAQAKVLLDQVTARLAQAVQERDAALTATAAADALAAKAAAALQAAQAADAAAGLRRRLLTWAGWGIAAALAARFRTA